MAINLDPKPNPKQTEEVRRIEEQELASFLPLLISKKRRLAERQADLVAAGVVVLGG